MIHDIHATNTIYCQLILTPSRSHFFETKHCEKLYRQQSFFLINISFQQFIQKNPRMSLKNQNRLSPHVYTRSTSTEETKERNTSYTDRIIYNDAEH